MTEQVKDYLTRRHLADPDGPMVYNDFYNQCRQAEVTEDEFFKVVLKEAVRELRLDENYVDPDPPNAKGLIVELFGERFHSLKRFGEVLFAHPDEAMVYLEDAALLKAHVNELSNGDQAMSFGRLYKGEQDPVHRLLRVIYALNPQVGYRIGETVYGTPEELILSAFRDLQLFQSVHQHYTEGWLISWLSALDADRFPVSVERDPSNFLRTVYRCGKDLPVFIDGGCYPSVAELVHTADRDLKLRGQLYTFADKGYLFIWAESRGWGHWRSLFKKAVQQLKAAGYKEVELRLAAVQELLRIMDVKRKEARLTVSPAAVSELQLPASKKFTAEIHINLVAGAYTVAALSLSGDLPAVSLSAQRIVFNEWEGQMSVVVTLTVEPMLLIKGRVYAGCLVLQTTYEEVMVPLSFRSVFPVLSYLWGILRYAIFGFFFLGGCRLIAVLFSGDKERLPAGWYLQDLEKTLPTNYWAYFFALVVVAVGSVYIFKMIRKYENI